MSSSASEPRLKDWLENRERGDNEPPSWHLEALPAILAAMEATGLPLDDIEIELGPPATEKELAAYDATLPKPMPADLREMWSSARAARWRVGTDTQRVLSPTEVVSERLTLRAELDSRIATLKKASQPAQWSAKLLDVLITHGDQARAAFDVRQEVIPPGKKADAQFFYATDREILTMRTPVVYPLPLVWVLGESFVSNFVDALIAKYPQIKKLKYGQVSGEKPAKKAAKKKPAPTKTAPAKPAPAAKPKSRR